MANAGAVVGLLRLAVNNHQALGSFIVVSRPLGGKYVTSEAAVAVHFATGEIHEFEFLREGGYPLVAGSVYRGIESHRGTPFAFFVCRRNKEVGKAFIAAEDGLGIIPNGFLASAAEDDRLFVFVGPGWRIIHKRRIEFGSGLHHHIGLEYGCLVGCRFASGQGLVALAFFATALQVLIELGLGEFPLTLVLQHSSVVIVYIRVLLVILCSYGLFIPLFCRGRFIGKAVTFGSAVKCKTFVFDRGEPGFCGLVFFCGGSIHAGVVQLIGFHQVLVGFLSQSGSGRKKGNSKQ